MSTHTHDNLCDWQPCATCLKLIPPCCSDCDNDDRDSSPTIPTFASDWERAPMVQRRLVTREDANYWWLRGQQAGRIAEQVETQKYMQRMMEGYSERVNR